MTQIMLDYKSEEKEYLQPEYTEIATDMEDFQLFIGYPQEESVQATCMVEDS